MSNHEPEPSSGSVEAPDNGPGSTEDPDYYNGWRRWDPLVKGAEVVYLGPQLAEMIGAGVVAADSETATWKGLGGHPDWDVVGDGVTVDVKIAWHHRPGVLGIPPPPKKNGYRYDPVKVKVVALVVLSEAVVEHEYLPDGTITLSARAHASAIYRVPAVKMNAKMRRDGSSTGRWLINLADISGDLVRGTDLSEGGHMP